MQKFTLIVAVCLLFCVDHIYSQLDSWPVVRVPDGCGGRGFIIDGEDNIYTIGRSSNLEYITRDSFISFGYLEICKFNSKGQLEIHKAYIDLDNFNNHHLQRKGPHHSVGIHHHDNKIYVHGKMVSPEIPTAFVYIADAHTLEEVATYFIEIPDVEEISVSNGTRLWIHENGILNLYVTISIDDQRIYKIEDNNIQMTYQFGFPNGQNMGSFLLNGELYTGRNFYDVTISKRDKMGGVISTYEFPSFSGKFLHNEDGVVSIYSPDLLTFTEEGFQPPYFRQEDFNPPLCTSCYTFIDFVRADDGSYMALGYGDLFNLPVTALHRFFEDGTTDYAFLYDPFYFPLDGQIGIGKISKGFVINGYGGFGESAGGYLTLIDKEGYLITATDERPHQARIPLLLYPNPVISQLIMELDEGNFHSGTLEVYIISGQMVHRQEVADFKTVIDVDGLAAGTYILRYISDLDGTQLSGKFVKVND